MNKQKDMKQPIILVGAPRSGTKMLREVLKLHNMIVGPQYELERLWCFGNKDKIYRKLTPSDLTPKIKNHIQDYFVKEASKNKGKLIIDKNTANSLRLDFVNEIFPDAPIIHIVRNGKDASCSIRKRWKSPADIKYIIKNRAFPIKELPYFLKRQFIWYLEIILKKQKHVNWWGPKFEDSEELLKKYSFIEICGIQWNRCVKGISESLLKLGNNRYIQVKYEEIIQNPILEINKIFEFLSLPHSDTLNDRVAQYIKPTSVGRWKDDLSSEELDLLMIHIKECLELHNYI